MFFHEFSSSTDLLMQGSSSSTTEIRQRAAQLLNQVGEGRGGAVVTRGAWVDVLDGECRKDLPAIGSDQCTFNHNFRCFFSLLLFSSL